MQSSIVQPLSINTNYTLLVTSVVKPDKSFTKSQYPGIPFYDTKVHFVDKSGREYTGKFIQPHTADQTHFIQGKEAEFHAINQYNEIGIGHLSKRQGSDFSPEQTGNPQRIVMQASGQTYTFAMGYAKDIFCAQIAAGKIDDITDLDQLETMAKQINNMLIEMQQEQTPTHR